MKRIFAFCLLLLGCTDGLGQWGTAYCEPVRFVPTVQSVPVYHGWYQSEPGCAELWWKGERIGELRLSDNAWLTNGSNVGVLLNYEFGIKEAKVKCCCNGKCKPVCDCKNCPNGCEPECGCDGCKNKRSDSVGCCGPPQDVGPSDTYGPPEGYATGYKPAPREVKERLYSEACQRHGPRVSDLPAVLEPTWDCRKLGLVPPIEAQGNCGSCYLFSATGPCVSAFIKAGYAKPDGSFNLSEQYGLDCQQFGGCGGGDETEVIDFIKNKGFPLDEYGPYRASSGRCSYSNQKLWKIDDWGYCTPEAKWGQAKTEDMKKCIAKYGPISVALDAGGLNGRPGSISKTGRGINHAVVLIGWDDSKRAFLLRNSWGTNWGDGGYCWLSYDSYIVEAVWAYVAPLPQVYKLFVNGNQVGMADGFPDVVTARSVAQAHANANAVTVEIKDRDGVTVETVKPQQPAPGPVDGTFPWKNAAILVLVGLAGYLLALKRKG